MTVLIDTNVILDVLLKREPFMWKSSNVLLYINSSIPVINPSDFLDIIEN